jgi:leader peptidase (prepilin peptidase) / N-methyltransferase
MLYNVCAVLLAPLLGSFISVVSARYPDWRSIAVGRSRCLRCGHTLSPRDLVPIVSWLAQQGRCRYCAGHIGLSYLWIELTALALVLWAAASVSGPLLLVTCALGWTLLALAAIDVRHFMLPDVITLPLAAAGLAVTWFNRPENFTEHVVGMCAGYLAFALITIVYRCIRKREGLGPGDAKLFAAAGAWLSWWGLPSVALIAGASGLAVALLGAALKRAPIDPAGRLPFGPYLAFGFWVVWLHGPLMLRV